MVLVLDMVGDITNHRPQQWYGRRIGQRSEEVQHKHETDIGWRGDKEQSGKERRQREANDKCLLLTILISQISRQTDDTEELHDSPHHVEGRESDSIGIGRLNRHAEELQEVVERFLIDIILEIEIHGRPPHRQSDKQGKGQ